MKTAFYTLIILIAASCSGRREDPLVQINTLETSFKSVSALFEMQALMLKAHVGQKIWVAEQYESVPKFLFKSTISGREYFQKKENLKSLSSSWPPERKIKIKDALALADSILRVYVEITATLKNFEDYENPAKVFKVKVLCDDEEILARNEKVIEELSEIQGQFELEIQNEILKLKREVK